MPYYDGTGPYGIGPYGRGRGPCRAGARSYGRGMGWGRGYFMPDLPPAYPPVNPYDEPSKVDVRRSLEMEAEMLERRLKVLRDQLREMGADTE